MTDFKKTIAGVAAAATLAAGGAVTANIDESVNPYKTQSESFYEVSEVSKIPEAGEVRSELKKDQPEVVLSRWNGAASIGIRYDKLNGAEGKRAFLSDKVVWKGVGEELHAYPLDPNSQMEDGGIELEVVLDSVPDSSTFDFQLTGYEDFDFFVQAPLTPEQIADGGYMPENVVGSIAVYHKTLRDHVLGETNYSTGKVLHIFRPKAIDANGKEAWGFLGYDEGVLHVVIPQEFLESATYPVTVDPTFGYTTVGASSPGGWGSGGSGCLGVASQWTTTESSAVYKMSAYMTLNANAGNGIRLGIYTDSGGVPNTLVASSSAFAVFPSNATTTGWFDVPLSDIYTLTGSTAYWVAGGSNACISGSGASSAADTTGGTSYTSSTDLGATGLAATFPSGSSGSTRYSIYATYASGGETATITLQTDVDFYAPTGVSSVNIYGVGGGGGGATRTTNGTGGGGGGGAYAQSNGVSVSAGTKYLVDIGNGGGASTAGADTTFNSTTFVADGGSGGTTNSSTGAAGGTTAGSTGTTAEFAGGAGGTGGGTAGGGGGESGCSTGTGNAGTDGASGGAGGTGCDGGDGGAGRSGTEGNGSAPASQFLSRGGGGGGGYRTASGTRSGGAGTAGYMVISYTMPGGGGGGGGGTPAVVDSVFDDE